MLLVALLWFTKSLLSLGDDWCLAVRTARRASSNLLQTGRPGPARAMVTVRLPRYPPATPVIECTPPAQLTAQTLHCTTVHTTTVQLNTPQYIFIILCSSFLHAPHIHRLLQQRAIPLTKGFLYNQSITKVSVNHVVRKLWLIIIGKMQNKDRRCTCLLYTSPSPRDS